MSSDSTIRGAAGEHFVMSQLLRRGMIAALAPAGVPNTDIVVTDKLGDRLCAVQVKVRREIGRDGGWHMKRKHETIVSPSLFYCFVDFGRELSDPAKTWVVPSSVVATALAITYQRWLHQPGRNGRAHKDHDLRRLLPDYASAGLGDEYKSGWLDPYFEKWDSLKLVT